MCSSSFANEQKRHEATHTFVTSMRMLRLKYVRSPWRLSRTSLRELADGEQSGSRNSATPSSNERRSPAASFSEIVSRVDMRPLGGNDFAAIRSELLGCVGGYANGLLSGPLDVARELAALHL